MFMGVCTTPTKLVLVTSLCPNGSLYNHLHVDNVQFPRAQRLQFASQIAQGMEYLHARHVIHRDLKSKSMFLHFMQKLRTLSDENVALLILESLRAQIFFWTVGWMSRLPILA